MAYRIKKETNAYYYIFTFESDKTENIEEFRRLANINDKVLRCLIINITKSYGYNASVNPKKIAKAEIAHKKYLKYQEE
jgi:small subunit ribosomal protein S6